MKWKPVVTKRVELYAYSSLNGNQHRHIHQLQALYLKNLRQTDTSMYWKIWDKQIQACIEKFETNTAHAMIIERADEVL